MSNVVVCTMNTIVVNEEPNILEEMRCGLCRNYLSVSPIMHLARSDTYACGRCGSVQSQKARGRAKTYEKLAATLDFPCRYDVHGCDKSFRFDHGLRHEEMCEFQEIQCPTIIPNGDKTCSNKVCMNQLGEHFKEKHPTLVLNESKFNLKDLMKPNDNNSQRLIVIKNEEFILQSAFKNGHWIKIALRHLGDKGDNKVEFHVEISPQIDGEDSDDNDRLKLKSYANFYSHKMADNPDALCIDLVAIKKLFKSDKELSVMFALKSVTEEMFQQLLKDVKSSMSQVALLDAQDESVTKLEKITGELECQICNELLTAPVSTCISGHSVCFRCRARLHECPNCKKPYMGTRNYQLEKVAEIINPAPVDNATATKKISRITCPVKILLAASCVEGMKCNWHGPKDKFRSHVERMHPDIRWVSMDGDDTSVSTDLNLNLNTSNSNIFLFEHESQLFVMLVLMSNCGSDRVVMDSNVWHIGLSARGPVKYEYNSVFSEGKRISMFRNDCCASLCSSGMTFQSGYVNPKATRLSFVISFLQVSDPSKYHRPEETKVEKSKFSWEKPRSNRSIREDFAFAF